MMEKKMETTFGVEVLVYGPFRRNGTWRVRETY